MVVLAMSSVSISSFLSSSVFGPVLCFVFSSLHSFIFNFRICQMKWYLLFVLFCSVKIWHTQSLARSVPFIVAVYWFSHRDLRKLLRFIDQHFVSFAIVAAVATATETIQFKLKTILSHRDRSFYNMKWHICETMWKWFNGVVNEVEEHIGID